MWFVYLSINKMEEEDEDEKKKTMNNNNGIIIIINTNNNSNNNNDDDDHQWSMIHALWCGCVCIVWLYFEDDRAMQCVPEKQNQHCFIHRMSCDCVECEQRFRYCSSQQCQHPKLKRMIKLPIDQIDKIHIMLAYMRCTKNQQPTAPIIMCVTE